MFLLSSIPHHAVNIDSCSPCPPALPCHLQGRHVHRVRLHSCNHLILSCLWQLPPSPMRPPSWPALRNSHTSPPFSASATASLLQPAINLSLAPARPNL